MEHEFEYEVTTEKVLETMENMIVDFLEKEENLEKVRFASIKTSAEDADTGVFEFRIEVKTTEGRDAREDEELIFESGKKIKLSIDLKQ